MRSQSKVLVCWLCFVGCTAPAPNPSPDQPSTPSDAGDQSDTSPADARAWGDALHFVPEGLPNDEEAGAEGGLTLIASTLKQTSSGLQLLAAIKNEGPSPACQAGITADFFDLQGQLVGNASAPLQGGRPYRLDADVILACIAPGEVAMAATTGLPEDVPLADLGQIVHRFPAFTVEVTALEGRLEVNDLRPLVSGSETSYEGTVTNAFSVPVADPSVAVFTVNRVGRPLSVATRSEALQVEVGGSWSFQTAPVDEVGVDAVAFASASLLYPQP